MKNERPIMKKLIVAATILAIAGTSVQKAKAGEQEWATVGKVLTGAAIGAIVVSALDCAPAHCSVSYTVSTPVCPPPAPVVCTPAPVVYAPPPVVVRPAPVVCAPPPVVVVRQPVVYAPAPAVVYHPPIHARRPRPVVVAQVTYGRGYDRHDRDYHRW